MAARKPLSPAIKRYIVRFSITMAAYVGLLMASLNYIHAHHPQGWLLWVLAVAPALPIVALIGVVGLYVTEETDEFQRVVLMQAMLWGGGVTMAAATVWGFLENVGLVQHFPLYLTFPVFCAAYALARPLVRWRYQ